MDPRFATRLIFTTTAWIDTTAPRLWQLLADARRWPLWWTAVARCELAPARQPQPRPQRWAGRWRLALGRPLHLAVTTLAGNPQEWLTLRLDGDLQGQATFMLQPPAAAQGEPAGGLALTCRCELDGPRPGWWRGPLALDRRVGWLMQTLVHDLGQALQCPSRVLGHWQGSCWRG